MQSTCSGAAYGDRLQLVDSATNCYSFDALLDFDLTPLNGIPASNIVSARLELYVTFAANTLGGPWRDFPAGAYPNRAAWNLSTNWFTAPPFDASAAYENRITLTNQTGVFRSWNATQAVKDWAGGTQPNYGLRLVALDNGQFGDFYNIFAPAGHADPLLRPRLVVQYMSAPPACLPPPSNLVSWWRAEGNANDSIDSNNGTMQNGATYAAGRVGQSFALDGFSSYVQVGDKANLRFTTVLTVEAWIFPTGPGSSGPGGSGGMIVNKEGEYEIARWDDGTIRWAIANTSPGWTWINTGYVAPQNQWIGRYL